MAGLHFDITAENKNLLRKLEEIKRGVREAAKQIEQSGMSIEQMFDRMTKAAAAFGAGFSAQQLVSQITKVRGEFQQLEVAFNTMLGSKEQADTLMSQLIRTAAITPFDLQGVANGAKQLLAYGTAAEDVNGTLVRLGDIAAGLSIPLNDLVWLYGTTMTQGRLFTQDLRQFQGRGIPLADELAKQFGVTKDKVGELVTAGKVGFPEVQKAIESLTNEGGKFGGLMEAQSKTITGQISNIEDAIATMYNNIGKQSEGFINDALSGASYLVENYETIGKTILELAAVYGTYKAVLMSVAAYQSFVTGVTYSAEIVELSKLIPLKQQSANEDVIAAVASGKLTQSKAEQIIALRAEIAAKIQSLQATEAQAKAEYASAMANYKFATQRMLVAKQNLAIAQSQMSIAIKSGTADEIAAAKKNAQTASLELNTAAISKNTAHKSLNIASTNKKTATDALSSMQTGINTAVQNANTASTNILTVAKTRLAAASRALGLSMLANPYVLVAAAITGLSYVIYKVVTAETELDKAHERLNDATKGVEKNLSSEVSKLTSLEKKLSEAKKGTEEYNNIKKSIVDNYGKYYKGLDGEIERVGNLSTVYGQLVEKMRLSIGQRKFESFFKAEQDNLDKVIGEKLDKAYNTLIEKYGNDKGAKLYQQVFDYAIRGTSMSADTWKKLGEATFNEWGFDNSPVGFAVRSVSSLVSDMNQVTQASSKALDSFKAKYQMTEKDVENILLGKPLELNEDGTPKENKTLELLISNIESAKEKLKTFQDQANKGLISPDEIKEQSDALSKLKAEYTLRTGKDYDRGTDLLKSQQELSRAIIDQDLKLQEMRLSILEDGRKKRLKQSELEYQQQKAVIEKEYQDTVQKYKDQHKPVPNSVKTTYEARLGANNAAKVARDNRIEDDYLKERREHEASLTAYMLSEESKRKKAIKERYDAEREWAKKQFAGENMTDAEYTNYLGRINTAETEESLQELLDKYQDYAAQRKDLEKQFNDEITTLNNSRTQENEAEVDRAIAEAQKKRKEALSHIDLSEFQEEIDWSSVFGNLDRVSTETLESLQQKIKNYLSKAGDSISKEDFKTVTDALNQMGEAMAERKPIEQLRTGYQDYKKACDEVAAAQKKVNDLEAKGDKTSAAYKDAVQELTNAQDQKRNSLVNMNQAVNSLGQQGQQVVQAGNNIVGMLTDLGVKVPESVAQTLDGVGQIMDGLASIDITKPFSIITSVTGIIGGIGKTIGGLFGAGNNKGKKDFERLQSTTDKIAESQRVINSLIEKRIDLIKKATIAEQKNLAATTEQAIKNQKAYYEQQFKNLQGNWLLDKKGKHNNLTAAQLGVYTIKDLEEFLSSDKLISLQKQGYNVRDLDKWKEIIDAYNELEDKETALSEAVSKNLTGITLDDARNALDELLKDADASMEDVAGSFEDYMRNAMLGLVKQNILNKALEDWYENFEDAVKNDGRLSETEVKDLQQEYENAFTTAQEAYNNMLKVANISPESDSSTRQATEKGIASMSQDSANELNGNFSALLISSNKTAEGVTSLRESMNYILEIQRAGWGEVRAIRDLTSQMRTHTEKISELSEAIASNTKRAATGIDTLNTKGLILKR